MGRAVIAEDGIEEYCQELVTKKELVVGLIFGQEISSAKSCVIHLARTPTADDEEEMDEDDESEVRPVKSQKKPSDDFEDPLVLDHARQVCLLSSLDRTIASVTQLTFKNFLLKNFYR